MPPTAQGPGRQRPDDPQVSGQGGNRELILLSGRDLQQLLRPRETMEELRGAYRQLADHRGDQGKSLGFVVEGGSIHVKAGLLPGARSAFAAKVNVNLPNNWTAHELPTIQGVVVLADAVNGRPLAIMESVTLTAVRTAATAALAATFGARKNSRVAAIIGCGTQARYQVEALTALFPIEEVRVFDINTTLAQAFATAIRGAGQRSRPMSSIRDAVDGADICVTCTTSKTALLTGDMSLTGCFVAAIGADNPEKQEIDPALMSRARILVDDLEQCATGGDLSHALRAGTVSRDRVHADLADLASGSKAGRGTSDELVIFDSTGSGVQDVAVAWAAYQTACASGFGTKFDLSGVSGRTQGM